MFLCTTRADTFLEMSVDAVGNEEFRVFGPAVIFLRQLDFRFAEWLAMRFVGILLVRRAVADVAVHDDQHRLVAVGEEFFVGARKLQQIVRVGHARHVPAIADESRHHVFAERPTRRTVQRHAVVVVDPAQIAELQVAGQGSGFSRDAFHQVAIAAHGVHTKIEQIESPDD